jgi:acyl carrier protein
METIANHIRRLVAQETRKPLEAVRYNSTLGQLGANSGDLARLVAEVERVYDIKLAYLDLGTAVNELTAEVLKLKQKEAA